MDGLGSDGSTGGCTVYVCLKDGQLNIDGLENKIIRAADATQIKNFQNHDRVEEPENAHFTNNIQKIQCKTSHILYSID